MIRRILFWLSLALILGAVACFIVVAVGVVQLLIERPAAEESFERIRQLQPWGIGCIALFLPALGLLWFVRDDSTTGRNASDESTLQDS